MPAEKYVTEFVKEAGFTPIPDRAIIVTYAPANMSERVVKFFSNEFFALQMCQDSLVLLPFGRMSFMLKKDVALEIPYNTIRKVEVKEDMLNWRIELDTDEGMIALSAQQKELSEWRHSGTLSVGMSGLGSGIMGSGALKVANWHRSNLDATLEALKALPGRRLHDSGISHCPGLAGEAAHPYHIPDLPVGYPVFPALCTSGRGNLSDALA